MTPLALHIPLSVRIGRRLSREESDIRSVRKASVSAKESSGEEMGQGEAHVSVLVHEVLAMLDLQAGDVVLDATAGAGGHAEAMLKSTDVRLIALDADPVAVSNVAARLSSFGHRAQIINMNFSEVKAALESIGVASITKALFDLGWNRTQLFAGRGFSFLKNEPLNMSYGEVPASGFFAKDILNTWSEGAIADVLFGYGEERYARRIAKAIVEVREREPIETTGELVALIESAVPFAYRKGRLHFATKTFQALRIAVNDEFGTLERGIRGAWEMLSPGGRLAVITFHSIEDRRVKRLFAELAGNKEGILLVKKPVIASREELAANPSARSAKLRGIEKVLLNK